VYGWGCSPLHELCPAALKSVRGIRWESFFFDWLLLILILKNGGFVVGFEV
jgi:hypothetical protein